MILLDNNVISEPMQRAPNARVIEWIDAQLVDTLYLSAVTVAELRFGIAVLPPGKRKDRLQSRLEEEVLALFENRILPFDLAASQAYADLMTQARANDKVIDRADGFIAAIAVSHGFAVATRDTSPRLSEPSAMRQQGARGFAGDRARCLAGQADPARQSFAWASL